MTQLFRTEADLDQAAAAGQAMLFPPQLKIVIGSASCGVAVGARDVENAARRVIEEQKIEAQVTRTGCIGFCSHEPLLELILPGGARVSYGNMTPEKTRTLLAEYAARGDLKPEWALGRFEQEELASLGTIQQYAVGPDQIKAVPEWSQLPFYRQQKKVILRNCGSIDPQRMEETIARGTYRAAWKAITHMTPDVVIEEILKSGLRGRGGAAFPTGQKWRLAREAVSDVKYIVCNADEGEPGAYMDRTVLESDPHAILEGMLIGAYAIGAHEGYIYIRSEYPLAIEILEHAIAQAEERGLLGEDIFGSGWSFRIHVRRGAGAYICGEETALIESLEGHAGEPRTRPPFPVTQGLWGKPTVVNNVKTWASVSPILTRGAAWYGSMGTPRTPGTTIFSLEGAVKNAGLVEVPFGITLRELVYEIGGGVKGDKPLKALQAGGASRGCIPPATLDLAIDTADREGSSIMIGTGGIIVLDDSACMVDMTRFLVGFFLEESCGKCVPCREGTKQLHGILDRVCAGQGTTADLGMLEHLAVTAKASAVCGLGGMAPNTVLMTLKNFREEFEAHIAHRECSAGVCEAA
jgi:NADH:ubiquinone oxidoreductase subunit F (NADH-binding)/(2Fe-2S) ferredoxin